MNTDYFWLILLIVSGVTTIFFAGAEFGAWIEKVRARKDKYNAPVA